MARLRPGQREYTRCPVCNSNTVLSGEGPNPLDLISCTCIPVGQLTPEQWQTRIENIVSQRFCQGGDPMAIEAYDAAIRRDVTAKFTEHARRIEAVEEWAGHLAKGLDLVRAQPFAMAWAALRWLVAR